MNLIKTKRTIIERITLGDAPFFLSLVNSPDWLRYIGDRGVVNNDDAREYLQDGFLRSYSDNGFGYYIIRMASNHAPIGICGFLKKPDLENPDFGFAFLPDYYGQGYAIESCRAVLDYGIRSFDLSMLDAVTMPDNKPSIRLLEKLGFLHQGIWSADTVDDELRLYRWQDTQ